MSKQYFNLVVEIKDKLEFVYCLLNWQIIPNMIFCCIFILGSYSMDEKIIIFHFFSARNNFNISSSKFTVVWITCDSSRSIFGNHKPHKLNVNHIYGLGNQRKNQRRYQVSTVYHGIHSNANNMYSSESLCIKRSNCIVLHHHHHQQTHQETHLIFHQIQTHRINQIVRQQQQQQQQNYK